MKTIKQFIEDAQKIHGDKYDYSQSVYTGSTNKIIIICPIHGQFKQIAYTHLLGRGCQKCSKVYRPTTEEFIVRVSQIHNNKYDYSPTIYKGVDSRIDIICPIHGKFTQRIQEHLEGSGCKKCGGNETLTTEGFIKEAQKVHGNTYDYNKSQYKNARTKIIITCRLHGDFLQRTNSHIDGCGCPICKKSHGERRISDFLIKHNLIYIQEKTFTDCVNPKTGGLLKFDFYIPSKNILIEYDGQQHFTQTWLKKFTTSKADLKSIKSRDKIKNDFAKQVGIDIIRIPYTKLHAIETILTKKLILCHSK